MPTFNLLYKSEYEINDKIKVAIPTVGEILDYGEDDYYSMVSIITSMPIDMMVQLDDVGVDYTQINEFELFVLLFSALQEKDTGLIFRGLDLKKFSPAVNEQTESLVLVDPENDIVIDRLIHGQVASVFRKLHHLTKNTHKPGNEEARKYMLERERAKQKRNKRRMSDSNLESLIIAMVNTEQYKYDYESTRDLSIYQFNESVHQIVRKVDYDNRMFGVYSGTISSKDMSKEDLNWLTHK